MALFVPHTVSPYAGGLSALADAIAAAPGNRLRQRQLELNAANQEADNIRAQATLDLAKKKAFDEVRQWTADYALRKAQGDREAALAPLTRQKTQGDIEANSLANEFNANKNFVQGQRISQMPDLANAVTEQAYSRVHDKMPAFGVKLSHESALPPVSQLPAAGSAGAMDFASSGDTAAMDELARRDAIHRDIGSMAASAVLDDNFSAGDWVDKTAKSIIGGGGYRPASPDEKKAFGAAPNAALYFDGEGKPSILDHANDGSGYRPATPQEKAAFGVKPDTPMVMDANNKPSILSDGKANVSVNTGGNAPETQIATEMGKRYEIARASSAALDALDNAQSALPGAITGAAANQRLALQKIGAYLGVSDVSPITDTETFRAAIQPVVAAVLHSTVGSSQISDADREFAAKAAAGDITLDSTSIQHLINIMRAANSTLVRRYNEDLNGVYPDDGSHTRERALYNVPNASAFYPGPVGPRQPEMAPIPNDAAARLKVDPSPDARQEFDDVFGPGAAARVLGGQ